MSSEEEIDKHIEEVMEIQKTVIRLKNHAADAYLINNDIQAAYEYVCAAVSLDKTNHVLWYNRAQLEAQMGCLHASLQSINKSLSLLKTYEPAIKFLGEIESSLARRLHGIYS